MIKEYLLRKFTDYYELKQDLSIIRSEVSELVHRPLSDESMIIKIRYMVQKSMYEMAYLANSSLTPSDERIFSEDIET